MSGLDTTKLIELASRRPKQQPGWAKANRLNLNVLQPGSYLAADPSLDGFGLVLIEVNDSHSVAVHIAQQFRVPKDPQLSGWEDILTRADQLHIKLADFMMRWIFNTDWGEIRAVHESPPIGHGKLINPEIALIASREFRRVTSSSCQRLPMVRRQDHARLVCGDGNASKQVHHAALKTFFPSLRGVDIVTNAATRDALSVALYAAQRGY